MSAQAIILRDGQEYSPTIESTDSATVELPFVTSRFDSIRQEYGNTVAEPYRHPNVGVKTLVSQQFGTEEVSLLGDAVRLFIKYYLHPDTISAAYNNVQGSNQWTRRRYENEMLYLFRDYGDSDPRSRRLYITAFYHRNTDAVARARVGVFTDGDYRMEDTSRANYFHIDINAGNLGEMGNDAALWAGVIAHEILHNIGFIHPEFDRTGNRVDFIYQYGDHLTNVARTMS